MITVLAVGLLLQDEATEQLIKSGKSAGEYASYEYRSESTIDSTFFGGTLKPKGKYEKSSGFLMKLDDTEVIRQNGKTVVKNPGEEWAPLKDDRRGPASLKQMAVKSFPAPHEVVAKMESGDFKKVEPEGATEFINGVECVIFKCELTDKGCRDLSGLPADIVGQAQDFSGTLRVWVDDKFMILRYKLDANAKIAGGFPATLKADVNFEHIGETKVDVPEPAKKALN